MKILISIFLIVLLPILGCSQDSVHVSQFNSLRLKLDSVSNRISNIEGNHQNSELIDEYKDLNSLLTVGFGILIGLFGLVFPVLLYIIQVKPSMDLTKEAKTLINKLDDDFDNNFQHYLEKNQEKIVDKAIEDLSKQNTPFISNSISILENNKGHGFNELQVMKLIRILKSIGDDGNNREFVARILTFQENKNTEEYFQELIEKNPEHKNCIWGAIYFATHDKKEHLNHIASVVIHGYSLTGMVASLCTVSSKFAVDLLNNEKLVNEMKQDELLEFAQYGFNHFINIVGEEIAESTLFWKEYKKRKNNA